ncbi:TPA: glycosyltransferase, partial [Escherichia coli]|nr:glycosyltransferase [Escherichia coli]
MDLLAESITEVTVSGKITNTDRVLNIAYGIDRNFLFGAAVSMQSVIMHNPDLAVKFHLFTDYIDEDYLQRVNAFTSKNANVEVRIYKVSSAFIDIFPSLKQWSYATFFRLVAFQYLSEVIENLLYIDADVICKGSLAGLLDINFDGDKFAAVIKDVPFMQEKPAKRLAIEGLPGNYFNAGVVYLQLEAWAKNDFMNKAIAMLASDPQHTKYKCLD